MDHFLSKKCEKNDNTGFSSDPGLAAHELQLLTYALKIKQFTRYISYVVLTKLVASEVLSQLTRTVT
jgi:hypothetical protein